MATNVYRPRIPKTKDANIKKEGEHYRVRVNLSRADGTVFSRDSKRKSFDDAKKLRDSWYEEFNILEGGKAYQDKLVAVDGGETCQAFYERTCGSFWAKAKEDKTVRQYKQIMRDYVLPKIGTLPMASVKVSDVRLLIENFASTPVTRHKSAKNPTTALPSKVLVQRVKLSMSVFFGLAVEDRVIDTNPVNAARIKWAKLFESRNDSDYDGLDDDSPTRTKLLDESQRKALLQAAKGTKCYNALFLMDALGMRPGEVLALRPMDFDLSRNVLKVHRAMTDAGKFKPTKTGKVREIPLPDFVVEFVKSLPMAPSEPISANGKQGKYVQYRKWNALVQEAVTKANKEEQVLPPGVTAYWLRHSFCSRMINEHHASPVVVASIAGHRVETLLAYYAHSDKAEEMKLMQSLRGLVA